MHGLSTRSQETWRRTSSIRRPGRCTISSGANIATGTWRSRRWTCRIPAPRIPLHVRAGGRRREALERAQPYLAVLARVDPIRFEAPGTPRPTGSVTTVLAEAEIAVPLGGLINVATEQARLQKTLSVTRSELERLQQRLESRDFTERAPAEVVSQQRQRAEELRARTRRLQELIDSLSTVE